MAAGIFIALSLVVPRILGGIQLHIRLWQIWTRVFRICGRSLDRGPSGPIACSISFSLVANGSYDTCTARFTILVSNTPSSAWMVSVNFFC